MTTKRHEGDAKGAVEEELVKIGVIEGTEVLGYRGRGREEHSGENSPEDDLESELDDEKELTSADR